MADVWYVTGNDPTYQGELPVNDEDSTFPLQQEAYELLGSNRKIVIHGYTLGREGSITAVWLAPEVDDAIVLLDYLASDRGPHLLENPFGESFYVDFGSQDRNWLVGGNLQVTLPWIETE
jgi:hypothetical protein